MNPAFRAIIAAQAVIGEFLQTLVATAPLRPFKRCASYGLAEKMPD
jgi:hypothetical protein